MNFHICHPEDALRPFVKQFYYWEDDSRGPIQLPQHLFALGDQYMVFMLEGTAMITPAAHAAFTVPRHAVTGHFTCACRLHVTGPVRMVIVQLNAYGCYRLLGIDGQSFTNYYRNLDLHENAAWAQLGRQLQQVRAPQEITALLNGTLQQALQADAPCLKQADEMADYMLARQGNVSVEELAQAFQLSRPTLERLFNRVIGMPPQLFARMVRFRNALQLAERVQWQLPATAHYNLAMFIRDHLQFNGEMPSWYNAPGTIAHMPARPLQQVAVAS
ncbi:hypothetical protein HF324_33295 [Chitinophaga oryzae]|uniref:HTH araC/xylS-type domain-containing protein n=1 Tax=Chitinophaga oryzae TaxID=2725414 RepID=A0ABX6LQM6_9BACT|nr:DUF6597 domain-containing transcriptional factor [Chitinophaga oryzae]QJB42468.1 hypothetical protein HF324_33295 [Chitinophaga oryzae]